MTAMGIKTVGHFSEFDNRRKTLRAALIEGKANSRMVTFDIAIALGEFITYMEIQRIRGIIQVSIIRHCRRQLTAWVNLNGQPADLTELLKKIPPTLKPIIATLPTELNDATDAVTIFRSKFEPWERRFLAVVNCRVWHSKRVIFAKWHEMVLRILEGQQLRLAFRKTHVDRSEPEEHRYIFPQIPYPVVWGTWMAQLATAPFSRWEASGITGDVPFIVNFSALPTSFVILAPRHHIVTENT